MDKSRSFIIAIILNLLLVFSNHALAKTIVINPGHTVGIDTGAPSPFIDEADLNELVSTRLLDELEGRGYNVYLTHCSNPAYSSKVLTTVENANTLTNLGPLIDVVNPDFVISIHHNYGTPVSTGYQIYWSSCRDYDKEGEYFDQSLWYGKGGYKDVTPSLEALQSRQFSQILNRYLKQTKLSLNGIFDRNDYIPTHVNAPAVLYEGGFLSNVNEAQYLVSEEFIQNSVRSVANALDEFFRTLPPFPEVNLGVNNVIIKDF